MFLQLWCEICMRFLKFFFTVLSLPIWKDPLLFLFETVWEKYTDINLKNLNSVLEALVWSCLISVSSLL